jgi:hypothetical protein
MKTLSQIREASGGKEAYQKFFNSLLKKFGVSSPSELEGDAKKKFYDAIDKGWDGDNEKPEKNERHNDPDNLDPETDVDSDEDMADKAASTVTEALRGARGKIAGRDALDLDYAGEPRDAKKDSRKHRIDIKFVGNPNNGQIAVTGDKGNIVKWLQSDDYGMDDEDIEDLFPELFEAFSLRSIGLKGASKRDRAKKSAGNIKAGRGNMKMDIDKDAMDHMKKGADKKHGITMRPRGTENILSGSKENLVSFVTQELGWDKQDIEDMWPDLLENTSYPKALSVIRAQSDDAGIIEAAHKINDALDEKKWGPAKKGKSIKGAKLGKGHPVMDQGQRTKIIKIAKQNSGNMAKAIKLIDRIRKGLSDNPAVMDILRRANEDVITERLTAGKGNYTIGTDVDWENIERDFGTEKKWIQQAMRKHKVKITKDVGRYHSGAEISGKKSDIIKFLQGPMYGGVEDRDIEDMWPWLLEALQEASRYSRELRGHAKQIFLKTLEKIKKERIRGDKDQAAAVDDIEGAHLLNGHDKRTIIRALQYEGYSLDLQGTGDIGTSKPVTEKVKVDRRTKGFKEAMMRKEKAKLKREKAKIKKEKKAEKEVLDARYEYDGSVNTVLAAANAVLFGKKLPEDAAANSVADGGVDMAPNAGKKKKKETIVRRGY